MKKLIPHWLKFPLIAFYIIFKLISRGQSKGITLNLAGVLPPKGSSKIVHGGKVKLLPLRERFGDSWKNFNIAYFVSSGLPFAPFLWLKIYKFFGIKIVWNQNGVAYPAVYKPEVAERVNGLMKALHLADYVFFQTNFTKRCSDKFLGEYKGKHEILINPVDTRKFKPSTKALPDEPFTIIMSGHHFESEERLRVSLESVRLLRSRGVEAKLIVIGNTQNIPQEDWIEILGKFSQEEAPGLYQRAHVLLHLKYLDPCPTIVLEALATGLPVIGQANGGMPELVSENSGILLDIPEDFDKHHYPSPEEVADAIMKVKDNFPEFSQNARKQALNFDKEIWLRRHEEIFEKLCRKSQ